MPTQVVSQLLTSAVKSRRLKQTQPVTAPSKMVKVPKVNPLPQSHLPAAHPVVPPVPLAAAQAATLRMRAQKPANSLRKRPQSNQQRKQMLRQTKSKQQSQKTTRSRRVALARPPRKVALMRRKTRLANRSHPPRARWMRKTMVRRK